MLLRKQERKGEGGKGERESNIILIQAITRRTHVALRRDIILLDAVTPGAS